MLTHASLRMLVAMLAALAARSADAQQPQRKASPPDARVFFVDLKNGATVPSRFTVRFGLEKMEIAPAGVARPNTGHHHLVIDAPPPAPDQPIPSDPNHLHFGRGQTEAEIILPAGEHTLQLVLGDQDHAPHDPPVMSEVLRVRVDAATVERARTPSPPGATVFFEGLDDGALVPTRMTIRFGVTGMALAPAGTSAPATGHHHLIIDAPPPDADREIPNDPNHLHFGKAQTATEVTLSPGPHTLQLALADHEHVPHDPPVFSKAIHVVAEEPRAPDRPASSAAPGVAQAASASAQGASGRTPAPPDAAVYFIYPPKGATIYPNTTVRFGLRNMGVAPAGVAKANTGHHHLLVDVETPPLDQPIPNDPAHLHFGNGQTEKKISLAPGRHTLQLILADAQHVPFDPPVMTERIDVTVMAPRKGGAKAASKKRRR